MRIVKSLLVVAGLLMVARAGTATAQAKAPEQAQAKKYHLDGKIVSVRPASKQLVIDAKAMPGFMGAMAMPYTVKDSADLGKVKTGDHITADVVVNGSNMWLENVAPAKEMAPAGKS